MHLPEKQIAYWATDEIIKDFIYGKRLSNIADVKKGLDTGNNNRFLRYWFEVDIDNVCFEAKNSDEFATSSRKWAPLQKGGPFRKWYGNNEYVVNWKNNGNEMRKTGKATLRNSQFYFREGISWSTISSAYLGMRKVPSGFVFETAGNMMFIHEPEKLDFVLAFLCSKVPPLFMQCLNPTITTTVGSISNLPIVIGSTSSYEHIRNLSECCVQYSKEDWDSFENSWDFKINPLIRPVSAIKDAFLRWKQECDSRFELLKSDM